MSLMREEDNQMKEYNENFLYEMALTIARVVQEKRELEKENKMLRKQVMQNDEKLKRDVQDGHKFIGEMFNSLMNQATKN